MESLLAALAEKGVDASKMPEEQVFKVAKACGIDPDNHLPRKEVVIGPYTNKSKKTDLVIKLISEAYCERRVGAVSKCPDQL